MTLKLGSKNKIIGFDILMTENLKFIFSALLLLIENFAYLEWCLILRSYPNLQIVKRIVQL
jgi:hypothetical protein